MTISDTTIFRRITDLSNDVTSQVIEDIKKSPVGISIQFDESTDISSESHLLAFVRYVKGFYKFINIVH